MRTWTRLTSTTAAALLAVGGLALPAIADPGDGNGHGWGNGRGDGMGNDERGPRFDPADEEAVAAFCERLPQIRERPAAEVLRHWYRSSRVAAQGSILP